jgi:taurine dioxygenase
VAVYANLSCAGFGGLVMHTVRLSNALGVELRDFDVKQPCSPEEQATLRRLFCEHHLLLVRGQPVTAEDQHRFVGSFGPIHEVANGNDGTYVTNRGGRPTGAGTGKVPGRLLWHSDGVYGPQPGIATSLWGQEVWPDSVPTWFANAARAFERLPEALRRRLEGLHAVFLRDLDVERTDHRFREAEVRRDAPPGRFTRHVHPVVWQTPHSDQKVLLVNELMTSHIVGLPAEEGEALIQELFYRMYADDNVYTHY